MNNRIRLGISRCLLGDRVRYDGQHKLDHFLAETLGRYVDYVPVCPEVEMGLPVPREPLRLVGSTREPALMTQKTGVDYTDRMLAWARRRVVELEAEHLCGFIFKAKSPSCGLERVKVYNGRGGLSGRAPGLFARVFMEHFPLLPVESESRLQDPDLRENSIERLFTLCRYREASATGRGLQPLLAFHARHKLLLMAHSERHLRAMGRLLADAKGREPAAVRSEYEALLLAALQVPATAGKHANVLEHMVGYFKTALSAEDKQELLEAIAHYRRGFVPLLVPLTLLGHHIRKHGVAYLAEQVYLSPHPLELKLRNHA